MSNTIIHSTETLAALARIDTLQQHLADLRNGIEQHGVEYCTSLWGRLLATRAADQ